MLLTIDTNKVARIIKRFDTVECNEGKMWIAEDLAKYFKKLTKEDGKCLTGSTDCVYPDQLCSECDYYKPNFDPKDFIKKCGG